MERLTLIATDGRRLAFIQRELPDKKSSAVGAIIPTKAINELARILSGDETRRGCASWAFTENQVTFQYKNIVIISRLIEGNFPSFDQVIPKSHDIQLVIKARQILQATQRAAVGTMDRGGLCACSASRSGPVANLRLRSRSHRSGIRNRRWTIKGIRLPSLSTPPIWWMCLKRWRLKKSYWNSPLL
jgi:DNA polymerase-3 subunit beta